MRSHGTTPNFQALDFRARIHQQDGISDDAALSRVFQQVIVIAGDDYFVAVRQFSQPLVEVVIHPGAFRTDGEVSCMDKQATRGDDESPVQFMGITDADDAHGWYSFWLLNSLTFILR